MKKTALGRVTVASDYASVVIGQYNSSGSSATSASSFSTSVLINALKEQESKIKDQQNQIDELKNLVNRLLK